MKKLGATLLCLTAALCMAACNVTSPADEEFQKDWQEDTEDILEDIRDDESEKGHFYEVLDSEGKTLHTINSEKGVEAVDTVLDESLDGLDELSTEAGEPLYTYVFWQERTLLAGEDPAAERGYKALLRYTVPAEGNVLGVEVTLPEEADPPEWLELDDLLTFGVELPEEDMEALRDPARFADG